MSNDMFMSIERDLLHDDPVVQEVLDTWLPRFLRSDIAIGDIIETLRRIETWDDWGREWWRTAEVHERLASEAETQGRSASATAAWEDAVRCHHLGYFLSVRDREQHDAGLRAMLRCHDRARPGMSPAVEKVDIPGPDGIRMVGLLSIAKPGSAVLIVLPGLDSTKETRHFSRAGWVKAGFSVLSLDGPGQGEASTWSTTRPDYESAISATVDWIEAHPELDASRIGLLGSSLGGYYAPRAAAREPRIRATVANCGPYDWSECWDGLPLVTREAFTHYSGSSSIDEARDKAAAYTLEGVLGSLERPLLVAHGSADPLIPWQQGRQIVDEAGAHGQFLLVEGGNHGINNLSYRWVPYARDWLIRHVIEGSRP